MKAYPSVRLAEIKVTSWLLTFGVEFAPLQLSVQKVLNHVSFHAEPSKQLPTTDSERKVKEGYALIGEL